MDMSNWLILGCVSMLRLDPREWQRWRLVNFRTTLINWNQSWIKDLVIRDQGNWHTALLELLTTLLLKSLVRQAMTKRLTGGVLESFCLKCLLDTLHSFLMSHQSLAKRFSTGKRPFQSLQRQSSLLLLQTFWRGWYVSLKIDWEEMELMILRTTPSLMALTGPL